jgi:hypothetical protein
LFESLFKLLNDTIDTMDSGLKPDALELYQAFQECWHPVDSQNVMDDNVRRVSLRAVEFRNLAMDVAFSMLRAATEARAVRGSNVETISAFDDSLDLINTVAKKLSSFVGEVKEFRRTHDGVVVKKKRKVEPQVDKKRKADTQIEKDQQPKVKKRKFPTSIKFDSTQSLERDDLMQFICGEYLEEHALDDEEEGENAAKRRRATLRAMMRNRADFGLPSLDEYAIESPDIAAWWTDRKPLFYRLEGINRELHQRLKESQMKQLRLTLPQIAVKADEVIVKQQIKLEELVNRKKGSYGNLNGFIADEICKLLEANPNVEVKAGEQAAKDEPVAEEKK